MSPPKASSCPYVLRKKTRVGSASFDQLALSSVPAPLTDFSTQLLTGRLLLTFSPAAVPKTASETDEQAPKTHISPKAKGSFFCARRRGRRGPHTLLRDLDLRLLNTAKKPRERRPQDPTRRALNASRAQVPLDYAQTSSSPSTGSKVVDAFKNGSRGTHQGAERRARRVLRRGRAPRRRRRD